MLLFGAVITQERAFLFEIIFVHDGVEVTVSKAVGVVIGYFVRGANVVFRALQTIGVILIGQEKVELDLGVVDWIRTNYFIQMVPLSHYLVVPIHVRPH